MPSPHSPGSTDSRPPRSTGSSSTQARSRGRSVTAPGCCPSSRSSPVPTRLPSQCSSTASSTRATPTIPTTTPPNRAEAPGPGQLPACGVGRAPLFSSGLRVPARPARPDWPPAGGHQIRSPSPLLAVSRVLMVSGRGPERSTHAHPELRRPSDLFGPMPARQGATRRRARTENPASFGADSSGLTTHPHPLAHTPAPTGATHHHTERRTRS